jgi:hypothetical protein
MTRAALLIGAAILLAAGSPVTRAEDRRSLEIESARIAFRGDDRLVIEADFLGDGGTNPSPEYSLRIEVGGIQVFPAESGPDGRWKHRGMTGLWTYRERRSGTREGVRRLVINMDEGWLRLKAKRLDLSALREAGPEDVEVALTHEDRTYRQTITFSPARKGWFYIDEATPPPVPGPFEWRIVDSGTFSPIRDRVETYPVALDPVIWEVLWDQHGGADGAPAPQVDLGREMVMGVVLAERPETGYGVEILSVAAEGGTLTIRYEETRPGKGCQTDPRESAPYVFIAVSPVVMNSNFVKTVRVVDCRR